MNTKRRYIVPADPTRAMEHEAERYWRTSGGRWYNPFSWFSGKPRTWAMLYRKMVARAVSDGDAELLLDYSLADEARPERELSAPGQVRCTDDRVPAEARQLIELAATVLERTANDTVVGRHTATKCREYLEATREPTAAHRKQGGGE